MFYFFPKALRAKGSRLVVQGVWGRTSDGNLMAGASSAGPRRELRRHRQVLARLAFAQLLARPLVLMLKICYDFHYLAELLGGTYRLTLCLLSFGAQCRFQKMLSSRVRRSHLLS